MLQPVDGALTTQSILPLLVLQDPRGLLQCLPVPVDLLSVVMLIYLLTTRELIQQRDPDMPFNDVLVRCGTMR